MPTHRLSPERRTDPEQLEKTLQAVKTHLIDKYDKTAITPLIQAIDELYAQIDFMHNAEGIGLFVSSNVKRLIRFFFPVMERVMIAQSFDTRDLLYESYYDIPYVVLLLSQKEAKLFNARLNILTAITDTHFPKKNEIETSYEYSRPSRGSSYVGNSFLKDFEKDKSINEEIRLRSFFRETDKLLNSYQNTGTPLVVTGEKKDLAYFKQVTTHEHDIACNIQGNYMTFNEHELGALTWKAMKLFLDSSKEKLVRDFKEKIGEGTGLTDIENIWEAALEGRGYTLLVEKDYTLAGYVINNEDYKLHLYPPTQPHRLVPDVTNRLIDVVLEKNGKVVMLDNDALEDFNRVALITRY
jgi:hypothetical protein